MPSMWCAKSCKTHATAFARLRNAGIHASSHDLRTRVRSIAVRNNAFCRWWTSAIAVVLCFRGLALHEGEQRTAVQLTRVMSGPCDRFRRTFRSWCTSRTAMAHRVCCITSCACCSNELLERTPARFDRFGLFPLWVARSRLYTGRSPCPVLGRHSGAAE